MVRDERFIDYGMGKKGPGNLFEVLQKKLKPRMISSKGKRIGEYTRIKEVKKILTVRR